MAYIGRLADATGTGIRRGVGALNPTTAGGVTSAAARQADAVKGVPLKGVVRPGSSVDDLVASGTKDIKVFIKADGKVIKGTFTEAELKRLFPSADVPKLLDDVDVKNAATTRKTDLTKLGIAGSLTAGVVFLMLATGEPNPIAAIQKAIEAAAEVAKDVSKDLFSGLFSSFAGFSAVCVFIICLVLIVYLLGSAVLKK